MNSPLFLSANQGVDPGTAGLGELLRFGVLGIFCVLLIVGLVWVVKAWRAAMEARIVDAQTYGEGLKEINEAASKLSTEVKATVNGLAQDHKDLKQSVTKEHGDLTKAVNDLTVKQGEFIARVDAIKASKVR